MIDLIKQACRDYLEDTGLYLTNDNQFGESIQVHTNKPGYYYICTIRFYESRIMVVWPGLDLGATVQHPTGIYQAEYADPYFWEQLLTIINVVHRAQL